MTVASRKMIVKPASRMFSAISFGVFWRLAPSTIAIMRSRNVSPGLAPMRTTSQSERTRVPPVTLERSPPLSRMTGADSPVIADSSTRRDALDRLAVHRDEVAGLDEHDVALAAAWRPRRCRVRSPYAGSRSFFAGVSLRARRSVSACALPRPSAIASAKLANSTVNQSQTATPTMNPREMPGSPTKTSSVVRIDPTKTTNITGLRI